MLRIGLILLGVGVLAGCSSTSGRVVVEERDNGYRVEIERDNDDYYERGRNHYGVPPGHMPPPGSCRIWYRDKPAGQQPPPGDCRDLKNRVPRGAILLRN